MKEEKIKEIDAEIERLEKKLAYIESLERNILELQILRAKLPLYFMSIPPTYPYFTRFS